MAPLLMKSSAGLLIYRLRNGGFEVFLIHPGGPFWKNKDEGAWSIPKGGFTPPEDALDAALREFQEETGYEARGPFRPLTPVKQSSYKVVHCWISEGDYDASKIHSNTFPMEWPPHSGNIIEVPEADRAEWFDIVTARKKILKGQIPFLDELQKLLSST
jgi:predicted NUDIX family NTP pyrophosphohydrolase